MIKRRRLHQIVFILAGVYNICWAIYSSLFPQWFFRFSGLENINHPEMFMCLAMVIGLYGVLYLEVARCPERGWLLAAIGLAGKILGPIGMITLIIQGTWPIEAIVLCITNDLIWWIPFTLYLIDSWKNFKATFK